jgi:DNA-binding response OmpR family regulator
MAGIKRILIVDDSSTIRYHISLMLKKEGFEVVEAANEFGLFNMIEEYGKPVDLIIMDIHLKSENGLDLSDKIKKIDKYAAIPIIILTDSPEKESVLKARELGLSDFLRKPVDKEMLVARLSKIFGTSPTASQSKTVQSAPQADSEPIENGAPIHRSGKFKLGEK